MQSSTPSYRPGPHGRSVRTAQGQVLQVPANWELLPPGDAALTRRVKAAGEHWVVQEKQGRRVFSCGVWAEAATIERLRRELLSERSTEQYSKRLQAGTQRRERLQSAYVEDFAIAVRSFLNFHPAYAQIADELTRRVTQHATPVGSGTVARTKRIPIEQRAQAAVIAWLRHQTTGYDQMVIPRVKGKRREVRRMLAERSQQLLASYRRGDPIQSTCPLKHALKPQVDQRTAAVSLLSASRTRRSS